MYMTHDEIETTSLSQQDLEKIQFHLGNYFKDIRRFTEEDIKDLHFAEDFIKDINLQNIIQVKYKYYNTSIDEIHSIIEIYLNNEIKFSDGSKANNFVLYVSDKLFRNTLKFDVYRLNFKGTDYEFNHRKTIYLPLFERLETYLHQMKSVFKHSNLEYWEKRKKRAQYELDTVNCMIEQTKKEISNLKEE